MVQANDECAKCGGPLRRESDGYLICSTCSPDTDAMGGDEMRSPVLIERPGIFRSWSALWLCLASVLAFVALCAFAVRGCGR